MCIRDSIIIKKTPVHICYQSVRNTVTDFPTLNLTAAIFADKMRISIGARPGKAMLFEDTAGLLKGLTDGSVTEAVSYTHLSTVIIRQTIVEDHDKRNDDKCC